jgi:hypothetical protein
MCAQKSEIGSGHLSLSTKIAVEMYRRRGMFDLTKIKASLPSMSSFYYGGTNKVFEDPVFAFTHPDIGVPSIQQKLQISKDEVLLCIDELSRKKAQLDEFKKRVYHIRTEMLIRDVDSVFKTNPCYFFASLQEAEKVLTGLCGFIRTKAASTNLEAHKHCLDDHSIASCFKEIKYLMNDVREMDNSFEQGAGFSSEAYDFMSGKSSAVKKRYQTVTNTSHDT